MHTNFISILGRYLNKIMKPLFNISGEGAFCFIMGIISGYPIGAKIASNFYENNICSKEECERLLSFTNNSGPLFIIGTVGISMYHSTTIGFLLFISHILSSITVGIIFKFWKKDNKNINNFKYSQSNKNIESSKDNKLISFSNIGEILASSITNSLKTVVLIGGFIVIFSCIISILNSMNIIFTLSNILSPLFDLFNIDSSFGSGLITGFLEITNGINQISLISVKKLSINLLLTSFLLGFGGISILLQVLSITSKSKLSIKPYIYGKLLHGLISALYTYLLILSIPIFNFDLL